MALPFKASKMVLKRKRSDSDFSASPTLSVSSFTSPSSVACIASPFARMEATPVHLHSRTMKRFRNNRPSENEVHQRTLNLLYSAQQHPQTAPTSPESLPPHQQHQTAQPSAPNRQQSLHRFWNINSAPKVAPAAAPSVDEPVSCDDCGLDLNGSGDEMDVDTISTEDSACGACGRHVCFGCSISNLGEQRRCLRCAGRKAPAGGIGWPNAGVPVCWGINAS